MLYGYQGEALVEGLQVAGIEAFRRGTAVATETGTVHGLWSILAKRAAAEETTGHSEEAAQLIQEARAIRQTISENIPEGEGPPSGGLRASFMDLPEVSTVLT